MLFKSKKGQTEAKQTPERFRVAKKTLFFDRFMTGAIIGGGLLVIVSVFAIFFFILAETVPLFGGADVSSKTEVQPSAAMKTLNALPDLNKEWVYLKHDQQRLYFYNTGLHEVAFYPLSLPESETITAVCAGDREAGVAVGTSKGRVALINDSPVFYPVHESRECTVTGLSFFRYDGNSVFAAVCDEGGSREVVLLTEKEGSAMGGDDAEIERLDLTPQLPSAPERALLADNGMIVQCSGNNITYFSYDEDDEEWSKAQTMADPLSGESVSLSGWLFGGNSIILGGEQGSLKVFSIYPQRGENGRNIQRFGETKSYSPMAGAPGVFVSSSVNRSFFVASGRELRLCYSTTGDTRWENSRLDYIPVVLAVDERFLNLVAIDDQGGVHQYEIDDKHPEAGTKAFFGKVWYEGYPAPAWQWQSVGGSDSYEPKLSLMPLMFGTLKGTVYALLFAVPIAILAAVYTAHFMRPETKRLVKPTMEIMASLPSVVLGFFGALYIAPLMEHKVPAIICMLVLIPLIATGLGYFWATRPVSLRNKYGKGLECLVLIPVILFVSWLCWGYLGEWIEPALVRSIAFLTSQGDAGHTIQTFPDLWRNGFGLPYEQRNSLVVGFIMGFAVIPVIFTIAEDALSNVPPSLIHASEALGASRWQVVRTIVLPVAAAGILSALMIGFGRAIGETMIVLMATGNTPVMEWDIFNGMRTLSANIATELPEAAVHSTHYRVLFLCGFILFVLTFILNTVAEVLRTKLRDRFKSA